MIKVQLEFYSVPEAIIALNAIMNLPEVKATPVVAAAAEVKAARRGRADKGHKRGEYKPRTEPSAPEPTVPSPQVSAPPTPAPAAEAPSPADTVKAEIFQQQTAHAPVSATIGEKDEEAQKLIAVLNEKKGLDACRVLLGQFGVSRIREIPTARRAEFLEEAKQAAA